MVLLAQFALLFWKRKEIFVPLGRAPNPHCLSMWEGKHSCTRHVLDFEYLQLELHEAPFNIACIHFGENNEANITSPFSSFISPAWNTCTIIVKDYNNLQIKALIEYGSN